jgi:hypothetical protein
MLTNKILSDALDIPLYKMRRWTKELLPPDPKATRRSGYARKFSNNDGFFVYLGGWLVSTYGIVFNDARKIVELLKPWLLRIGLVPDIPDNAKREGIDSKIKVGYEVNIYSCKEPGKFYIEGGGSVGFDQSNKTDESGREYTQIVSKAAIYWIEPPPAKKRETWATEIVNPMMNIKIQTLLDSFLRGLEIYDLKRDGYKVISMKKTK